MRGLDEWALYLRRRTEKHKLSRRNFNSTLCLLHLDPSRGCDFDAKILGCRSVQQPNMWIQGSPRFQPRFLSFMLCIFCIFTLTFRPASARVRGSGYFLLVVIWLNGGNANEFALLVRSTLWYILPLYVHTLYLSEPCRLRHLCCMLLGCPADLKPEVFLLIVATNTSSLVQPASFEDRKFRGTGASLLTRFPNRQGIHA